MTKALVFALTCITSSSFAAALYNRDNKPVKFTIQDGGLIRNDHLKPRQSEFGLCTPNSKCSITYKGQRLAFDANSRDMIIEKGRITFR
jgi:hypothetical protein